MKKSLVGWMCALSLCLGGLVLNVPTAVSATMLWSADFESPTYTQRAALVGQNGWWHWNTGTVTGWVGNGQAWLGASNGWLSGFNSPRITTETSADKSFQVTMTVYPGAATVQPCYIQLVDNSNHRPVTINFDPATHLIMAGGSGSASISTGVTYTAGTAYQLVTDLNNANNVFSLTVNGTKVFSDIATGMTSVGFEYIFFNGGDNHGAGAAFTYLDDISVSSIPEPVSLVLLGLGAMMLRRRTA